MLQDDNLLSYMSVYRVYGSLGDDKMINHELKKENIQLAEDLNHQKGLVACAKIKDKHMGELNDNLKLECIGLKNQVELLKQQILRMKNVPPKIVQEDSIETNSGPLTGSEISTWYQW